MLKPVAVGGYTLAEGLLVLANPAAVPVDLEIEVNQGCPESRVDRETVLSPNIEIYRRYLQFYLRIWGYID